MWALASSTWYLSAAALELSTLLTSSHGLETVCALMLAYSWKHLLTHTSQVAGCSRCRIAFERGPSLYGFLSRPHLLPTTYHMAGVLQSDGGGLPMWALRVCCSDRLLLATFLGPVQLALIIGYHAGMAAIVPTARTLPTSWAQVITVIICLQIVVRALDEYRLGLNFVTAFTTPMENRQAWMSTGLLRYISVALNLFSVSACVYVLCYWRLAYRPLRVLAVCWAGTTVVFGILGAARHSIYATIVLTAIGLVAARVNGQDGLSEVALLGALGAGCLLFFGVYSSFIALKRHNSPLADYRPYVLNQATPGVASIDIDLLDTLEATPDALRPAVLGGLYYFTGGYYGLMEALQTNDPPFGMGLGHSRILNANWSPYTRVAPRTPHVLRPVDRRREDSSNIWVSAYPWIASDVTVWGVAPIMCLVGYGLCRAWRGSISGRDPYSAGLLGWLFWIVMTTELSSL